MEKGGKREILASHVPEASPAPEAPEAPEASNTPKSDRRRHCR